MHRMQIQIHPSTQKILYSFLPETKLPLTVLYQQMHTLSENSTLSPKQFRSILQKLVKKEILKKEKNNGEPIYFLSSYGKILHEYCFPFAPVGSQKYTTIFVLPEIAAKETKYSAKSFLKKRVKNFHYITLAGHIYILKRERIEKLLEHIPAFPVVKDLFQMVHLFPDPFHSLYDRVFTKLYRKNGWFWPEVLETLMAAGSYISPEKLKKRKKQGGENG